MTPPSALMSGSGTSKRASAAAAFGAFECFDLFAHPRDRVGHADLPLIDAGNRFDRSNMPPEHFLERHRDFTDGRLGACSIDRQREQIAIPAIGSAGERIERLSQRSRIALGQSAREPAGRRTDNGSRPLGEDCINRLVQRARVRFPEDVKFCTIGPRCDVVGHVR